MKSEPNKQNSVPTYTHYSIVAPADGIGITDEINGNKRHVIVLRTVTIPWPRHLNLADNFSVNLVTLVLDYAIFSFPFLKQELVMRY